MDTRGWRSDAAKNVVIVVSLVAAGFLVAYRFVLPRVVQRASYTDGREVYDGASGERIRYAVWDAPEAVPGGVNSPERESRPALSPDGRWLVFAVGTEGLNADLWLAEMVHGEARDARPIAIVNSVADGFAPAFGPDALYFASNRGGGEGGFDLYVSDFDSGSCGAPRWIETPGVNTSANEVDPAPAGAPTLFFASDRDLAGYDLFVAAPHDAADPAEKGGGVKALVPLNSRSDEREPALTADLRTLFFASDRGGGFDLYRSMKEADAWLPPLALGGINGAGTERGPAPSPDGFALYYEGALPGSAEPGAAGELMRARSLELFRLPPRPVGWLDLLLIVALFLLALLAWLAKTWEQLDVIYRCLLLSILVHLLLMWWFRHLHPEGQPGELVPGTGEDRVFAVQLLTDRAAGGALRERGGALEVARAAPATPTADVLLERLEQEFPSEVPGTATQPEPTQGLERARGALAAAPAREAGELTPARPGEELTERTPELHDAPEGFERSAGAAPGLAVVAQSVPLERAADPAGTPGAPERAEFEATGERLSAVASSAGPVQRIERREASTAELGGGGGSYTPSDVAPARQAAQGPSGPELAQPREEFVARGAETPGSPGARSASAPEASLPAPTAFAPVREAGPSRTGAPRADEGPRRLDVAPAPRSAETGAAPEPEFRPLAARSDDTPQARPAAPSRLAETPYRSRFGHEKEIALEQHGGTQETEQAVAQGLAYLARIQTREGHWGSQRDYHEKYHHVLVGKTGLALLAFLGAGHTQQSNTEFSRNAERAIAFLLSIQSADNGHFGDSEAYSHGIATYALAECYALTRDERLRQPIERAIARILSQQITRGDQRVVGGWSYYYPDGRIFDRWPRVSITSWQVMALESALLGGLSVPEEALAAARQFLLGSWDGRLGAFRYSHDPERLRSGYPTLPGSTPAALFALSLLGEDIRSAEYEPARRFLLARAPDGYRFSSSDEFVQNARGNLYFWYYGSLALLRVGGSEWDRWNAAMQSTLLPSQEDDGSWRAIDVYGEYAGDDDSDRSYSTALNVLTLEVYYRYFTPLLEMR